MYAYIHIFFRCSKLISFVFHTYYVASVCLLLLFYDNGALDSVFEGDVVRVMARVHQVVQLGACQDG